MDQAFASLAQIRVLLLPVPSIHRPTFNKWAAEVREFEEIRLSDVPADSRDDRARFMPNPLATGSLLINFVEHPPSPSCLNLDLFRPSEFPLGLVGIASCSQSDVLSSIYSEFNACVAELFPSTSIYPLARNCFVFEEGDGNTNLNVGNHMPGLVVIPSMMGNKKLYIGTLLAELCSNILGEFSMMVKTLETPPGTDALNNGLFARMPNYRTNRQSLDAQDAGRPSSVTSPLHSLPETGTAIRQSDPRLNLKRASTLGPGAVAPSFRSLQQGSQLDRRRQSGLSSGMGTPRNHARLYKVLGDLFLLAGRTMDASIWYNEAVAVLKGAQDLAWQASALEGMAIAGVLEAWSNSGGSISANSHLVDSWADFGDKLSRAVSAYAAAAETADSSLHEITYLYIGACLRQASLMYYVWLADGLNELAFDALLHGRFDSKASDEKLRVKRSATVAGISRADVSEILTQAHGPWLLHLGSRERVEVLRKLARMYSGLRYKRKEAYILRELLASLLDLLVQGREEARGTSDLSLGVSSPSPMKPGAEVGSVSIREKDDVIGNTSILRVVKYICEVHGIDLDTVGFTAAKGANGSSETRRPLSELQQTPQAIARRTSLKYLWPELHVGLIRESLAVAEALPDYAAVASFALSALRDLYPVLDPEDQFHLHTAAGRAMATVRRRGDERKLEYWPVDVRLNIRFLPLPFIRLPVERPWSVIEACSENIEQLGRADPFLFNPRRALSKRQTLAVANESLDFIVTLENPYSVALEILEMELCTSGVRFVSKAQSVIIQGNTSESVTLSGQATEAGILFVRGCSVALPGIERYEIPLPVLTEEEEENRFLKSIAQLNEGERVKSPSLIDRLDRRRKHISAVLSETGEKVARPPKYLELKVVPEQPCLRIRRTSLTNGAVMLYEGETSVIRVTVENISNLPIDFLELTFEDSTKAYLEQAMNDERLNAFDMYETEYSLVNRPVFSWKPGRDRTDIPPGKESAILVKCFGRAGCTDGTIFLSYSYARRQRDGSVAPPTVFFSRQLLFPVLVSVYQMLECSGMNILPISVLANAQDIRNEWDTLLADVDDTGWCVMTLDVQNIYGLAFEVTLSYNSRVSTTRIIPPGSTYRLVLPIERFSLPASASTEPIPSLTNRQYVVSGLPSEEDKAQRELFWHREELLKRVRASWKEAAGSRTGELSLRRQRFTQPMLNALRMDDIRVSLLLCGLDDSEAQIQPSTTIRGVYATPPNTFTTVKAEVQNLTPSPLVLSLSLSAEPSDYFTYDGVLKDIPLGRVDSQESREHEAVVVFLAQGQFKISAQVRSVIIGQEARICGTGSILVESQVK